MVNPRYDPEDYLLIPIEVAKIYLKRQEKRGLWDEGIHHIMPGKSYNKFKSDLVYLWFPRPIEVAPCCLEITPPTKKSPFSYFHHCKTFIHLATLYKIDPKELKAMVITLKALKKIFPEKYDQ